SLRPQRTPAKVKPGMRTRCAARRSFTRSRLPVALLVLLAAAAGAGVVAADLVAVAADGLDLRRRLLPVRERDACGLPLPALHRLDLGGHRRRGAATLGHR